jgi:ABC-type multidrug transport system ATPase subunit
MEIAIEVQNLRVSTDGFDIIKDVSVSFPRGRSTIVMGASGSGKSTLLKVAAAITPAVAGSTTE